MSIPPPRAPVPSLPGLLVLLVLLVLASGGAPAVAAQDTAATPQADTAAVAPGGDTALQDPVADTGVAAPPSPPGQLPPESDLELLRRIYARMPGLTGIEVRLDGRILELSGTAFSFEDREMAETTAREILPGIAFIDTRQLSVEADVRRRVEPAVERLREKGTAFLRFLPSLLLGLLVLVAGMALSSWIGRRPGLVSGLSRNPFVRGLILQVLKGGIVLVALLVALDLMAITTLVGAVLGAAGVFGIAVGFAFRDIVENYLAGLLLALRQPFAPRDHIRLAGEEGQVVRLTGRETILMTLDGNHVRIPNATVFKSVITNLTRNPRRRFLFAATVASSEELGRAQAVAADALAALPGVLHEPPVAVRVSRLLDAAVELEVAAWVDQSRADFGKVRSQAIRAVKEAWEAAGVATPPPEYGIRMLEPAVEPSSGPGGPPPERTAEVEAQPVHAEDVSPDRTIEKEIEREDRESPDENLLRPQGSPPA